MKPPGGECHDLFGAAFNGSPSHLRVLKPPGGGSSDIFGGSESASEVRRVARAKQQTSQLFLGSSTSSSITSSSSSSSASSTASDHADAPSNGVASAKKTNDGNPVTGEGYDASSKPSTPLTNGNSNSNPPSTAQARQRVPPGGFSSGLW